MKKSKELLVAMDAAKKAGKIALKYFRTDFQVEKKQGGSPVTIADKECEAVIIKTISKHFPDHAFLGEESGSTGESGFTWIIDPIDGTKAFMRGLENFGVSIGLRKGQDVILGVMLLPCSNELFFAEKGKGAFLNGKQITVSKVDRLDEATVFIDSVRKLIENSPETVLEVYKRIYSMKSTGGLDVLCNVACGRADAYIGPKTMAWDIAAGKIIIEEAGGKMTDFVGKNSIDSGNCIASNGKLHQEILSILGGSK